MPLAETEVLPIVQSSTTKKVTVAELTTLIKHTMTMDDTNVLQFGVAGVTASINYNGDGSLRIKPRAGYPLQIDQANIKISDAGYGIDFSANAHAAGMTSELLNDYEEGIWTPVVSGSGTAGTYEIGANGSTYTKVGRMVTLQGYIQFAAVVTGGGTGDLRITGLPYTKTANSYPVGSVYLALGTWSGNHPTVVFGSFSASSTLLLQQDASGGYGTAIPISFASANAYLTFTLSYEV